MFKMINTDYQPRIDDELCFKIVTDNANSRYKVLTKDMGTYLMI